MAAATYKYYFGDLLTGGINYEIPCFGVTYDRRLNKAGNATFSVPLAMKGFNVQDILDNTQVGRGCLYIERNGQIVWGGIIWSRTYQSSSRAFNCTAQTFESFLYKQFIEVKQSFVAEDQRQIVVDLITNMQAKPSANIGIIMPTAFGDPLSTVITRTKDFYSYIGWSYGKAIEDLISYLSGNATPST